VKVGRDANDDRVDIRPRYCQFPVVAPSAMKLVHETPWRVAFDADDFDKLVVRRLNNDRGAPARLQAGPDEGNLLSS
jgi:hypothetical protein